MQLRPYQERMIQEARELVRQGHRRILFQLPTGGGKTVVSGFLAHSSRRKDPLARVWFVCHRDFLIEQTYATYQTFGLDPAVIAAKKKDRWRPLDFVQICGVATVVNRLEKLPKPKIIHFDEAHHVAAGSWAKIVDWAKDALIFGFSATPERLDGKGLGEYFTAMVKGPTVAELMDLGSLSRYKAYAPSTPDTSEVRKSHGDFNQSELEELVDKPDIVGDVVEHYRKLALGKRAIYFGVSVDHSRHIADAFNRAGIRALHLDASSSPDERSQAARAFARGELEVLSNVELFGEGYDLAAQAGMDVTIEAVGLCRPTQSLALYLQQVGRALRPKPYPAVILDHAGNIERHGLPDDEREWSLEGRKKGENHNGVKVCPMCFAANPHVARVCEECGAPLKEETEPRGSRELVEGEGELVEIDVEALRRQRVQEERLAETLEDFLALAAARGYKRGWAYKRYDLRQGREG